MFLAELDFSQPSLAIDLLLFMVGICVGSFLNVVALRSLSEESVFWPPSKCPQCHHRLAPYDNIPVLSYLWLRGRCRYCQAPISWQYPAVEAFTGLAFVAIERTFLDFPHSIFNNSFFNHVVASMTPVEMQEHLSTITGSDGQPWSWIIPGNFPASTFAMLHQHWPALQNNGMLDPVMAWSLIGGALVLACTLIAVTITDFKEKLIPHEITYPSMIFGLLFSAFVRHDLLGALAGVGASYILFDFIAFYGLKFYILMHGGMEESRGRRRRLKRRLPPRRRRRMSNRLRWRVDLASIEHAYDEREPLEVMGGGDAVLSAVLSAYLGWQMLVIALFIGFLSGTMMGLFLLCVEMAKAKLLHKCARLSGFFGAIGATVFGLLGLALQQIMQTAGASPAPAFMVAGFMGGALLGLISVGTKVSKPYPFGPALALGGFVAMFLLPNWLSLH